MNRKDAARIFKEMRTEAIALGYDGKTTDAEALESFFTDLKLEFKHAGKAVTPKMVLNVVGGTLEVEPVEEAPVEGNEYDDEKMDDEDEEKSEDKPEEKSRGKSVRKAIAQNHNHRKAGRVDAAKSLYARRAAAGKSKFTDADSAEMFAAWFRASASKSVHADDRDRVNDAYRESGQYRKDMEVLGTKDANTVDPTLGGSLLRESLDQNDIVIKDNFGVARRLADVVSIPEKVHKYTLRGAGNTAFWTGEGAPLTNSELGFAPQMLVANKLAAFDQVTMEIFTAPGVNIADKIAEEMLRSVYEKEDTAWINGNGEVPNGGFIGLKPRLRDLDATAADIDGLQVASSATWASMTLSDIYGLMSKVTKANDANKKFLCSNRFAHLVLFRLAATQGGAPRSDIESPFRYSFQGHEVVIDYSGSMSSTISGQSDEIVCLFGDFKLSSKMLEVQNSIRFATSEDFLFDSDEVALKYTEQVAFNVHGQGSADEAGSYAGLITP